ncbi:MAG: hypothetical protein FWG77_10075 [Treponema sp.]|nr:hypothetical protein [Treponema sp.]
METVTGALGDIQQVINLLPGIYNIELIAYRDDVSDQDEPWAHATLTGHTVSTATSGTIEITLAIYDPSTDEDGMEGTFKWEVTFENFAASPPDVPDTTAMMYIEPINGTHATDDHVKGTGGFNLLTTGLTGSVNEGTESLNEGYYWVDFEIEHDNSTISFRQVLHLYRFMESFFDPIFDGTYFGVAPNPVGRNPDVIGVGPFPNIAPTLAQTGPYVLDLGVSLSGQSELELTVNNLNAYATDGTGVTVQWYLNGKDLDAFAGGQGKSELSLDSQDVAFTGAALGLVEGNTYQLTIVVMQPITGGGSRPHALYVDISVIETP